MFRFEFGKWLVFFKIYFKDFVTVTKLRFKLLIRVVSSEQTGITLLV